MSRTLFEKIIARELPGTIVYEDEHFMAINKQAIIDKLEAKAGPQARALFERFTRDIEALSKGDTAGDIDSATKTR